MQLRLVDALPEGDEWSYEIKFDGFRCIAIKDGQRVTLISRHGKSLTPLFRDVAASIAKLKVRQTVIDGELVALNENGRPAFQLWVKPSVACRVAFTEWTDCGLLRHPTYGEPR